MIITQQQMRGLAGLGDGASTSKLFYFPSDIAAAVAQTNGEMNSLSADFDAAFAGADSDSPESAAHNAFNSFYNEWREFADNLGWWAKMSGSTVSQCQSFRLRAADWRKKLVALGGSPSTPELQDLPTDQPSPWASTLKWVAGAAVAIAAIYGVSQVVGVTRAIVPLRSNPRRRRRRSTRRKPR